MILGMRKFQKNRFEKQRRSARIAPSPPAKLSSSFEKDESIFPCSSTAPPKQPQRKYDDDENGDAIPNDDIDASHQSTSSRNSTDSGRSVSSISVLRNSITPWNKNQQERKTRKGRKKNKKKEKESSESPSSTTVVTFNKKIRVRKICRVADMSEKELEAKYYSNRDMIETRNSLRAKIRSINEEQQKREDRKNFLVTPCRSAQEFIEDDDNYDLSERSDDDEMRICCGAYYDENCDCHHINECNNDFEDMNENEESVTCLRGLEHEFPKGKQRRRKNKAISRDMVFHEQRYWRKQRKETNKFCGQFEDPALAIAEAYITETLPAIKHARNVGTNDENIAKQIYNEDDIISSNDDDGLIRKIKRDSAQTDVTCHLSYSSSLRSSVSIRDTSSHSTERNNDNNSNIFVVVNVMPYEQ